MKIAFFFMADSKYEPPGFVLEPETEFETRWLQQHFLRRLPGQVACRYEAAMLVDHDNRGTGEVAFRCVDNGLPGPYHWEAAAGGAS